MKNQKEKENQLKLWKLINCNIDSTGLSWLRKFWVVTHLDIANIIMLVIFRYFDLDFNWLFIFRRWSYYTCFRFQEAWNGVHTWDILTVSDELHLYKKYSGAYWVASRTQRVKVSWEFFFLLFFVSFLFRFCFVFVSFCRNYREYCRGSHRLVVVGGRRPRLQVICVNSSAAPCHNSSLKRNNS